MAWKQSAAFIFAKAMDSVSNDFKAENSRIKSMAKAIWGYPIKVIAMYFAAPFLIFNIARLTKNRIRRLIAIAGLSLSFLLSYAAATILGSFAGFLFIASKIGILAALGFLIGTTLSLYLSVIFSIIVFNSVSFLFLKLTSEEVVEHLKQSAIVE